MNETRLKEPRSAWQYTDGVFVSDQQMGACAAYHMLLAGGERWTCQIVLVKRQGGALDIRVTLKLLKMSRS